MRKAIAGAILLLAVSGTNATAQTPNIPSCTSFTVYQNLYQEIIKLRRSGAVTTYAETNQPLNGCAIFSVVEAFQVAHNQVHANQGVPVTSIKFTYHYEQGDWVQSTSKHYGRLLSVGPKIHVGERNLQLHVQIDPAPAAVSNQQDCEYYGYIWDWGSGTCQDPYSPIVLDMGHNGIQLTSVAEGVHFDLNADGEAEQIAWTREGSDDAWLARDLNGNGIIDNGEELFGNVTPVDVGDGEKRRAADGFVALSFLHKQEGSWFDTVIDARDSSYAQLLVWTDTNHNGFSEPEELRSAADAGLVSISIESKRSKRKDENGNEFRLWAPAKFRQSDGTVTTAKAWDVWLLTLVQMGEPTTP